MRSVFLLVICGLLLICSCSVSGIVVDKSNVTTSVDRIDFEEDSVLKVYHGGAIHLIPAKSIKTVQFTDEETMTYDGEFYISATVILQDGTRKAASGRSGKDYCFVSVNNALTGKSADGDFTVPVSEIITIEVH